jgi:hypothetical protein
MKISANNIDYGIYIDQKRAFIISLDHIVHEALIDEEKEENKGVISSAKGINEQEHIQNKKKENIKKFCKAIIEKIVDANDIVVFGPSTVKHELQKEITNTTRLKTVKAEIAVTDVMNKDEACLFVKNYYSTFIVDRQVFTGRKK